MVCRSNQFGSAAEQELQNLSYEYLGMIYLFATVVKSKSSIKEKKFLGHVQWWCFVYINWNFILIVSKNSNIKAKVNWKVLTQDVIIMPAH